MKRLGRVKPLEAYPGNQRPWRCQCLDCGAIVTPTLASVRNGRRGCRQCGLKRGAAARRLDENDAIHQMLVLDVTPIEPYPGSHYPWKCRCNVCGTVSTPRLRDARKWRSACKTCGYARGRQKNMLSEADAEAMMTAAGVTPLEAYPGSMRKWKCRCNRCGKVVSPLLNSIQSGQGACNFCALKQGALTRRIPATEAILSMQEIGNATPLEPYPGSMRKWRCQCNQCGNEITPTLANVRNRSGHACKFCAEYGLDRNAPAVVYLVEHSKLQSLKVGVMNETSRRLKHFARSGWVVVKTYSVPSGKMAEEIEERVFKKLESAGISRGFVPKELMPYSGHSETLAMSDISTNDLQRTVDREVSRGLPLKPRSTPGGGS